MIQDQGTGFVSSKRKQMQAEQEKYPIMAKNVTRLSDWPHDGDRIG